MECQIMDLSDDIAYSVHDVEDSIATGAFDPIVLADPKMLDHIIEQTRAWYGAKWDADKLLAAFMRLRREYLFLHIQWFHANRWHSLRTLRPI